MEQLRTSSTGSRLRALPKNFTADAIKQLFLAAGGIPRELNNLASAARLRAFTLGVKKIDGKLVKQVLDQKELN